MPPRAVGRMDRAIGDVGGHLRRIRPRPGRINPHAHVDLRPPINPPQRIRALAEDIGVGVHPCGDDVAKRRLVQAKDSEQRGCRLAGFEIAQHGLAEERQLLCPDLARLMLIGDRLDEIGIAGLLRPRPLRAADQVEMVAVPDVQAERQVRLAPLDEAIQLAVKVLVALEPELLPHQRLGVVEKGAQEGDERAVVERLAGGGFLHEVIELQQRLTAGLGVDPALGGLGPCGGRKVARRAALNQRIQRRVAFIAPHEAVEVVVAHLILDHRMDPRPVAGVRRARLAPQTAEDIHFHRLRYRRDFHRRSRPVTGVFEERLHQLDEDLHAPRMGGGDDHLQDVAALELGVAAAVIGHERVAVIARIGVEIGPAAHLVGLWHAMVRPAVQNMADRATRLQPQPRHRAQHQHVDARAVLQDVQHRLDPLIDNADRADLDPYELLGGVRGHAAALARVAKSVIRRIASWIIGRGCR